MSRPARWTLQEKLLLLVALDGLGAPELGPLGIAAGIAEGAALAEQVPALVEGDLQLLQPLPVAVGRLALRLAPLRTSFRAEPP